MNERVEHNTDSQQQRKPIDEDRYGIDERNRVRVRQAQARG